MALPLQSYILKWPIVIQYQPTAVGLPPPPLSACVFLVPFYLLFNGNYRIRVWRRYALHVALYTLVSDMDIESIGSKMREITGSCLLV